MDRWWIVLVGWMAMAVVGAGRSAEASAEQKSSSRAPKAEVSSEELFPFVLSYEPSQGLPNLSGWLHRPAGKYGFVRVQRQGEKAYLATDAGPIRFWATNLCFEACFPSREEAQRLAARLASLGINCVRLHHMDSHHIWGKSGNLTTIDPQMLDRLDWLIYQLQEHGIYTNINLHVSRWLDDRDGFPHRDRRPTYDKGLGNFEPRMIELQRKYARDLLRHVNPYTKLPYAENPAIAFVEISNEDALFAEWGAGHLDDLPDPYATTFRKLWNAWLRTKYGTTEKLRSAWQVGEYPLGPQMLQNGDFSKPFDVGWRMERDRLTDVSWTVLQQGGPENRPCLQVVVRRQGEMPWNPQFSQAHLAVQKGTPYTLRFYARSPQPRKIAVNCMMAHEPWENLGLSASVSLGPRWKEYSYTFTATRSDPNARITFTSLQPGTYELADVRLQPGGIVGLGNNERLEEDSVPILRRWEGKRTPGALADWIDFLWELERRYWHGMYRFLKEELGVRSLVCGTQLSYSPPYIQAGLDYIDAHSYWQHPHFPGRPWDPANWTVQNIALVNSPGGTLAGLAERRILGHAFTVSEYNHPAPNVYAAEGFPMLAAFAAFQGWDAIYSFTYSHNREFEVRRITGFFDIKSDPSRLVHFPACAAMFLRADVQPAQKTHGVPVSLEQERQNLREHQSAWAATVQQFGLDRRVSLLHAIGMKLVDPIPSPVGSASGGKTVPQVGKVSGTTLAKAVPPAKPSTGATLALESGLPTLDKEATSFVSDTGQLRWDVSIPNAGYFTVDTPRTKLFTGFIRGRTFRLGEVEIRIGKTRLDWATVSMTVLEGESFRGPGRILLAATGWVQNTGAVLKQLGNQQVTLGNQWGQEPVLCEGIPAEVVIFISPDRVKFYALDEAGRRALPIQVEKSPTGHTLLRLGPSYKTLWYEIEIK
ncbi:MAG: carbohydrate binding domain-containing protein [Thermoguttaceae bacterium]|nr:carbohydrate binding domain-containing protein [Thermoguttaceae bacterium]MDW8037334.1 carbohydrate binding domain-containing protein [Thermoguttaceae bacterium]